MNLNLNQSCLLSWIIFTPLVFALLTFLIPGERKNLRPWALLGSVVNLVLCSILYSQFDGAEAGFQFMEKLQWIPALGTSYSLGIDGISLPLVMLTAIIAPIAILGTWPSEHSETKYEKSFVAAIFALQTGMYGTFLSLDLFLFYVFWEVVLIPMFFLIGVWGGQNRLYATVKFFLYTLVGSLLMLIAIIYIGMKSAELGGAAGGVALPTLFYPDLLKLGFAIDPTSFSSILGSEQTLLFLAFTLAFMIKVPAFPFHTWLPDAHVQAPTLGSVFLAAVLLKMGTYGLMRMSLPLFPQAAFALSDIFFALGVIGVIYGAFCALAQDDFKKLVAYSSVSHMGYIVVGLFAFNGVAFSGSLYQMINHGFSAAGLFLIVGFLYERLHTRDLNHFGSLAKIVPLMAISFLIVTLSSVALPGTNGFIGEFAILLGTFQTNPTVAFLCGLGVIFGAVYALKAYQMVMLGPLTNQENKKITDLNFKELLAMIILTIFIFGIGLFPRDFFIKSQASLEQYATQMQEKVAAK